MSKPENVLARYRSYAYHHILIACDSTETALALASEKDVTSFQRLNSKQGRYDPVPYKAGGYVVLVDGLTDSNFFITSAQWNTVIAPNKASQNAMVQLDGDIAIVEPYGARFMNVITNVCDSLETDPSGLVFVLKTIFVGHNDDLHSYNTEMHSNFRPLLFTLIDISAQFDETGARYNMAVVGAANGFGKLPHVSKIARGFSMNVDSTVPLSQTLEQLANKLNEEYDNVAKANNITFGKDGTLGDYRKVEYRIIADDYGEKDGSGQGVYRAGTNENVRIFSDTNTTTIQPGNDLNVENVIDRIMRSSKEVMEEASKDNEDDKYVYKISSFLRSSPERMIVEYQVNRYKIKANPYKPNKKRKIDTETEVLEFDYIFTGLNTDIIEMDIKMEMGLAFFHTAATTNNIPNQIEGETGGAKSVQAAGMNGGLGKASSTFKHRRRTPLFLGDQITSPLDRNSTAPVSSATFKSLMSRHAALENLGIVMKIHGNPQLMSEMLKTHVEADEPRVSFLSAPQLVKVNIQMPAAEPGDFSDTFWYDGYYMLHSIQNTFDDGVFTQELTLFSVIVADETLDRKDDPQGDWEANKGTLPQEQAYNAKKAGAGGS